MVYRESGNKLEINARRARARRAGAAPAPCVYFLYTIGKLG